MEDIGRPHDIERQRVAFDSIRTPVAIIGEDSQLIQTCDCPSALQASPMKV
jgi:hypothetical protein